MIYVYYSSWYTWLLRDVAVTVLVMTYCHALFTTCKNVFIALVFSMKRNGTGQHDNYGKSAVLKYTSCGKHDGKQCKHTGQEGLTELGSGPV